MLQVKSLTLLSCLLLLALLAACTEANKAATTTVCPPDGDNDDYPDRFDNDTLCDSFKRLRSTIEKDTLVELIQSHYQCNSKFRKAMCYYDTKRFRIVAQQLQQSDAYVDILLELNLAGVDTSDIENIVDIFACIVLPVPRPDNSCDCRALRGHTFIGDLLAAMPQQAVHEINTRAKRNNFARFVQTVNSSEFQAHLQANLLKRDAARPLHVLSRNGWNVPELLRAVMTILSW
ncbi:CG3906 [Drosophila busckii]|uniref:CG3906 n=1 Tax=Drosophila busckii TaxID=30019 RepID=A0A0M4EK27_DROBS|nr:uncharacterized protein LOC108595756 [Drosophila busckii]ALC41692.1 CG3906 [Drosophila busckii]